MVRTEERHQQRKNLKRRGDRIKRGVGDERSDPPPARVETAHLRKLPDFIIIGTQRGGTTSLYRYLTQHPEVGAAFRKEVHFFDRYYEKGLDWYLAHFPERGDYPMVGEASPFYLFHPAVPGRVHAAVPHAKFIALLRNPIDRAYSQYHHKLRRGLETLSFEAAIDQEAERLAVSDDPVSLPWRHHSYLARGVYVEQVKRWLDVFPREQLLVIQSETFFRDTEQTLHETQSFLGLPVQTPEEFRAYHLSEYPDMSAATRRQLQDYFAPYNQQLYDLLGCNYGWENE